MTAAETQPLWNHRFSGFIRVGQENAHQIGTHLSELRRALTVMKGGRQGDGVTAPHKLRQFLTNLAAIVTGPSNLAALLTEPSDTRRATKKQIQQLGGAIMDHGRMVSQLYSHQEVGVEVKELAFRFRETTHSIVTALVLLEKEGRACRTRLAGYWTLHVPPQ